MKLYPMPDACWLDNLLVLEQGTSYEMIKMSASNGCCLPVAIGRSHERRFDLR